MVIANGHRRAYICRNFFERKKGQIKLFIGFIPAFLHTSVTHSLLYFHTDCKLGYMCNVCQRSG